MTDPVLFDIDDDDYIEKLNAMSQKAGDLEGYKNTAVQAAAEAEQARVDIQALAETSLPNQAGNKHKAFITDGVSGRWEFTEGFNRKETADHVLEAGDEALVIAASESVIINSTLPATIRPNDPLAIKNSLTSKGNVRAVNTNYTIYDKNDTYLPGENPILQPGEMMKLFAISATELEVTND